MVNDLTTDTADGQRALAWKALSLLFYPISQVTAELGDSADQAIAAALTQTDHEMRPVPAFGIGRQQWETAIDERLRKLGAKVLPTAGDAAATWREAMVEALADLPAMIALSAAKKAIHRPYRFIGEVEPAIREIAADMIERRRVRRDALTRMHAEIERAANAGQPQITAPDPEITPAGIRAMKPELRALGLKAGFITQEQIDAALAEQDQLAA